VRRLLAGAIAAGAVAVGAGCSANAPGDINAAGTAALYPAVENVRSAAAAGTYAVLRAAVRNLKSLVVQEQTAGNVSPSRANAILDQADILLQDAKPTARPSPSPTSESPTPTPTVTSISPTPTPTPTVTPTPTPSSTPSVVVSTGGAPIDGPPTKSPTKSPTKAPTKAPTKTKSAPTKSGPTRSGPTRSGPTTADSASP
jgi:outer membrane biosynthesis protein TonB